MAKEYKNKLIRIAMIENDLTQSSPAKLLGVSESEMSTMLKYDLAEKEQKRIVWIISNQEKYKEMTENA